MPPLRERQSDIPQLAMFFLARYSKKFGKNIEGMARATLDRLTNYAWPGNIRELQNVIERAVILSQSSVLELEPDLIPALTPADSSAKSGSTFGGGSAGRFRAALVIHSGRCGARSYRRRTEPNSRRRRGAARGGKNFRAASQYPSPPDAEVGTQAHRLPRIVVPTTLHRVNHQILWLARTGLKSIICK